MTIQLPNDLESAVQATVRSGHFPSIEAAMTEAVRLLLQKLGPERSELSVNADTPDPLLGLMKDHAELMDEIVEDAMRNRERQPWRINSGK